MYEILERRYGSIFQIIMDRLRANFLRLRGARLGARTRIGRHCIIQRPWCFVTGPRTQIEHNVFVKVTDAEAMIHIGEEVFVGSGSEFDISKSLSIGKRVLIAPGCFITDHDHRRSPMSFIADQGCEITPVRLEDDVWLGAHVIVLAGVTMHKGAIAAAGAVVCRDVESMSIVGGVPARVIGRRT